MTRSKLTIHRDAESKLQDLARHIEGELPAGVVFTLCAFSIGDGGYCAYVSNANRADMIEALTETLVRLNSNTDSRAFADPEEMHFKKSRADRRREAKRDRKGGT